MRSLSRCAAALAQCRVARTAVCEAITGDAAPKTVADAYEVQRELHSLLSSPIISVVGQKIGCTTAVMQEYLHIPHPCAGGIYDNALWRTTQWRAERSIPHSINRSQWHHVGLECEIAVQLKTRLGPGAVSREEAASAIGSVHAAVEIVDDRYEDFRACKPPPLTWIADDFFHGGSVLGLPLKVDNAPLDPMLLDRLVGVMSVDGRAVGAGSGADIINGHPLEALRWLAGSDAAPDGLPAGWVVSLGSVCRTHWLGADESRVRVRFELSESSGESTSAPFEEVPADADGNADSSRRRSDSSELVGGTVDIDFQ